MPQYKRRIVEPNTASKRPETAKEGALVHIPGRDVSREANPASHDLGELAEEIVPKLQRASGVSWYEEEGNDVDQAVAALCRIRRAGASARSSAGGGDAAVREMLTLVDPATVTWIASRMVSYMDEQGFPDTVPERDEPAP
jgi:hypothetical protein